MHPDGSRVYSKITLADLEGVALDLVTHYKDYMVWLFVGEMGAGKTTLIKVLGKLLGVKDMISSPTFSIVNEYEAGSGQKLFHFDFYRIRQEAEAYDIGVEEYFDSGNYCFVEWPEKIPSLIPAGHVKIDITHEDKEHRTIAITVHDGEEKNRL